MREYEYYTPENEYIQDEKNNNMKNFLLFSFIIILAFLIEKIFRNSFIRTFCFIIIFFIVMLVISRNLSDSNMNKIKFFLNKNFSLNFKSPKLKAEIEKKNLEKTRKIYESGYIFNKMNNKYINNQIPNRKQNKNNNYDVNRVRYDEDLANKISNINRINDEPLINTFTNQKYSNEYNNERNSNYKNDFKINNFNYNFNNNDNDFEIKGRKKYTNNPNDELFTNNDSNENIGLNKNIQKEIISSPFEKKTRLPPSSGSSSGNFFLLSNRKFNKQSNPQFINNFNDINPINSITSNQSFSDFGNTIYEAQLKKIPKNKEISYNKYQYLKSRYPNTQALNQNNNKLEYNKDKIPKEFKNINFRNWNIKMKNFISRKLIPNLVTKHDENINNLNSTLNYFGIKIISTLPDNDGNDYLKILNEKIYFVNSNEIDINLDYNKNKLSQILFNKAKNFVDINNYNYKNKVNNDKNLSNVPTFPSLMNIGDYLNDTKDINNNKYNSENELIKIFYGDTNKIKHILGIIENKLSMIEIQKNIENRSSSNEQRQKLISCININNNPFLRSEDIKKIDNYFRNKNYINDFTLTNLQRLLYERIIINERLYPKELFDCKDETHALLVLEYSIERFRQLQINFNHYGNGSGGGDFLNESWCSLLPTDSQLISHLIINYLEALYEINFNRNQQIFLSSYPNNYNILTESNISTHRAQTSIFLYQINPPNVGPKFFVVYDGNLIPCPLGDINLFHAFSIYFYLLFSKSMMLVMNLGIYNFISELIE